MDVSPRSHQPEPRFFNFLKGNEENSLRKVRHLGKVSKIEVRIDLCKIPAFTAVPLAVTLSKILDSGCRDQKK